MSAGWVPARAGMLLVVTDRAAFERAMADLDLAYQAGMVRHSSAARIRACLTEVTAHDDQGNLWLIDEVPETAWQSAVS